MYITTSYNFNHFRNTSPFLTELLSKTTFPFVWDDPSKELEVKLLAGDLGNGCLRGTAASLNEEAEKIPLTGCLITANFNLQETEK